MSDSKTSPLSSKARRRKKSTKIVDNKDSRLENISDDVYADDEDDDVTPELIVNTTIIEPVKLPVKPGGWSNFFARLFAGLALLSIFFTIIYMGHLYSIILVVLLQTELYRELVNVRYVAAKEHQIRWFRTIQWGWFLVPMFFVYGDMLHKFCLEHRQLRGLIPLTRTLPQLSYLFYCVLFVSSISTFKQGLIRYQLSHYMWSIVTVCLVVFTHKFWATNILNGLFWFAFPISCVVFNDCAAYFCGKAFGKKFISVPLTPMSPNKSWEGFIGAAILTLIWGFYASELFSRNKWFICPADNLYISTPPMLDCEPNPVFIEAMMDLPIIGNVRVKPIQLHALSHALFASLLAPFGGFLASAIKRAYKIKDFDSLIPGHGGVMDRVDCQTFMAGFTTVYYVSMIAPKAPTVDQMVSLFASMSSQDQKTFLNEVEILGCGTTHEIKYLCRS